MRDMRKDVTVFVSKNHGDNSVDGSKYYVYAKAVVDVIYEVDSEDARTAMEAVFDEGNCPYPVWIDEDSCRTLSLTGVIEDAETIYSFAGPFESVSYDIKNTHFRGFMASPEYNSSMQRKKIEFQRK